MFLFSSGMYSQSNQDFVRGTIVSFYETYGLETIESFSKENTPNGNLVCPLDDEEGQMRIRNQDLTRMCASRQFERLKDALRVGRRVAHLLVEVGFIATQLQFTLFRLLIPGMGDLTEVMQEVEFWFMRLVTLIYDSLKEIGNLCFRIVTDTGGVGDAFKALVGALCWLVQAALYCYNISICWILKVIVAPICQIILDIIRSIMGMFGGDVAIFGLFDTVLEAITSSTCDATMQCSNEGVYIPTQEMGILPVTSRCWADYTPSVDDKSSYSCSASDTCSNTDQGYGLTNQVRFLKLLMLDFS
jgi:hypothetical protein